MFVKTLMVFSLLLALPQAYAVERHIYVKVTADNGNPVEFCVVRIGITDNAIYSDATGTSSLFYNADSAQSLTFFCLGYETREVKIDGDSLNVVLNAKWNQLDDVVFTGSSSTGRIMQATMGKKNLKPFGICACFIGNERAIFLAADSAKHG